MQDYHRSHKHLEAQCTIYSWYGMYNYFQLSYLMPLFFSYRLLNDMELPERTSDTSTKKYLVYKRKGV